MLRSLKSLQGHSIAARDGDIGTVYDFLFDDEFWLVRYVVADTGHWLPDRKVLIAPHSVRQSLGTEARLPVDLTREQVERSPDIDTNSPVSRRRQTELHRHYGWPLYWAGGGAWPDPMAPFAPLIPAVPMDVPEEEEDQGDPHLRSFREVMGYHIKATDGLIGHAQDLIVDLGTWEIRYLIVDTRNWIPGKKVLISPQWLVGPISWLDRTVSVFMNRESVQHSPEFNADSPVNREYEVRLYDYYGRPGYWSDSKKPAEEKT